MTEVVVERDEPWWEPDGTPTTSGPHPHYALWDHEGRKWDHLPDGVVLAGAERDALLAVAEAARRLAHPAPSMESYVTAFYDMRSALTHLDTLREGTT